MNSDPYRTPESEVLTPISTDSGMFSHLANFGFQRSKKQAFGFYIVYLVLGSMLGFAIGGVVGMIFDENPYKAGLIAGTITAVVVCTSFAILISVKKSLLSSFATIFTIVFTVFAASLFGALGGLLPVAYLTTKEAHQKS